MSRNTASSHADMIGGGGKELQAEGAAIAKALRWEHTSLFRENLGHSAKYPLVASQSQTHPSVPAL